MNNPLQLTSREILDVIIRRTILIYRWAVYASFVLIGSGFLITITANQRVDAEMLGPIEILRQVLNGQASGFFGAGIAVMILTPIVMIATGAATFIGAGDRRYGLITYGVATILALSIAISFVTG